MQISDLKRWIKGQLRQQVHFYGLTLVTNLMAKGRPRPWLVSTGLKEIARDLSREELTSRIIHRFPPATSLLANCNTLFMLSMCRRSYIPQLNNLLDEKSAPSKHLNIKVNEKSVVDEVAIEADEAEIACTEVVRSEVMVTGKEHELLLSDLEDGDTDIYLTDTEEIVGRYHDSVDGHHFLHAGKALEHQSTNQWDWEELNNECSLCTQDSSETSLHDAYLNNYSESIPEFDRCSLGVRTSIEDETNSYSDLSRLTEQMLSLLEKLRKCESMLKPVVPKSRSRNEHTGTEKMETGALPVSESRASKDVKPFRKMSSKPEMPGKAIQRIRNRAICCTGFKNNDIVPSEPSFMPLIHQRQQAITPVTGKREIRVKALKVAEAAKHREEKKQKEREMRKEALKLERERLQKENTRKLYQMQKAIEEAKKKKDVEFAARQRQIEEERKYKDSKRKCTEGRKQHRERLHDGKKQRRAKESKMQSQALNQPS